MGGPNKKYSELSEEQKEKRRAAARKYYAAHPERVREFNRRSQAERGHLWKQLTPEELGARQKKYRDKRVTDPVRQAIYLQKRREWEAERRKERHDAVRSEWNTWRRNNAEKYNQQRAAYWNEPKRKEALRQRVKDYRLAAKEAAIDLYGGCCNCCGENHIAFLTIDHINGDGAEKRKSREHGGGHKMYRKIVREGRTNEFQLLCWNCNIAKHNFGQCPHKLVALYTLGLGQGAEV